jgi:hypothetical protein
MSRMRCFIFPFSHILIKSIPLCRCTSKKHSYFPIKRNKIQHCYTLCVAVLSVTERTDCLNRFVTLCTSYVSVDIKVDFININFSYDALSSIVNVQRDGMLDEIKIVTHISYFILCTPHQILFW